jgi:hypothetical protein
MRSQDGMMKNLRKWQDYRGRLCQEEVTSKSGPKSPPHRMAVLRNHRHGEWNERKKSEE